MDGIQTRGVRERRVFRQRDLPLQPDPGGPNRVPCSNLQVTKGIVTTPTRNARYGPLRWTVREAIMSAVTAPVITAALFARFGSRQDDSPAMRVVATLRNQFGGHAVRPS